MGIIYAEFSRAIVEIMKNHSAKYSTFDILSDEEVRQGSFQALFQALLRDRNKIALQRNVNHTFYTNPIVSFLMN